MNNLDNPFVIGIDSYSNKFEFRITASEIYYRLHKKHPITYYTLYNFDDSKIEDLYNKEIKPNSTVLKEAYFDSEVIGGTGRLNSFIVIYKGGIIEYNRSSNAWTYFYYETFEKCKEVADLFVSLQAKQIKDSYIHVLIDTKNGLALKAVSIEKPEISIPLNYSDGFQDVHTKVVDCLQNKYKGIYMFGGEPGTGKTFYLRYLTQLIDRPFIFIPSYLVDSLISPSLLSLLIEYPKCVIIVEDAEKAIIQREENNCASFVSTILNLADGFMSDVLQCSIILTFNINEDRIDKALVRKGRLMVSHRFEELDVEKSNQLLQHLEKDYVTDKPMTLAAIYNVENEPGYQKKEEEQRKIGFL